MVSDTLRQSPRLLAPVAMAYELQLKEHGARPNGVLWNDLEGQTLRFELLLQVMEDDVHKAAQSINDLGCGYGALFDVLKEMPPMTDGRYIGYDISEDMVQTAKARIQDSRAVFLESLIATHRADYSFASGTYNMKQAAADAEWEDYVKESLLQLWDRSDKGLAFNLLDGARRITREDWLYYADGEAWLEFCRRNLSPNAKLVDSHPLREWTLLVRR